MDKNMNQMTRKQVLEKLRRRYETAGAEHKRKLLDQAVQLLGYHRKSAIRALRQRPQLRGPVIRTGRPVLFEPGLLLPWLRPIWQATDYVCGQRLVAQLRADAAAVLIGSTNSPASLTPDIVVAVGAEEEKKFQEDPFLKAAAAPPAEMSATNELLAFVDHTSEADLVRKRIKDGEDDGEVTQPRVEPPQPVIRDPALARAVDLLKALAALHPARG